MSTLDRIARLRTLQSEWASIPDGRPQQRDRWFEMVGTEIAALPGDTERTRWIAVMAATIHRTQRGLPMSICKFVIEQFVIEQRVKSAQKGVPMVTPNVRVPLAASGTAEECLAGTFAEDVRALESIAEEDYRDIDRRMMLAALVLGLVVFGMAFWPEIAGLWSVLLAWMTPFKYGFLIGSVGTVALMIGLVAVGVCLGAGRLEPSKS